MASILYYEQERAIIYFGNELNPLSNTIVIYLLKNRKATLDTKLNSLYPSDIFYYPQATVEPRTSTFGRLLMYSIYYWTNVEVMFLDV